MGKDLYIALFILIFAPSLLYSQDSTSPDSVDIRQENCQATEALFQAYLVGRLDGVERDFNRNYRCYTNALLPLPAQRFCEGHRAEVNQDFQRYERLFRRYRTQLARQFARNHPSLDLIQMCYGPFEQIQMGNHSRMIRLRPGLDESQRNSCRPLEHSFFRDAIQEEWRAIANGAAQGLSQEEMAFIREFRQRPIAREADDSLLNSNNIQESERMRRIGVAAFEVYDQAKVLKSYIANLGSHRTNKLYVFQNEFSNFINQLSPELRSRAQHCNDTSYFARECGNISVGACLYRTFGRPIDAITDYTPLVSALKLAFTHDYRVNQASFTTGIRVLEEYNAEQIALLGRASANFPNISAWAIRGGAQVGARVSAPLVARAQTAMVNAMVRNNYRNTDYFFDTNITTSMVENALGFPGNIAEINRFNNLARFFNSTPEEFVGRTDIFSRLGLTPTLARELRRNDGGLFGGRLPNNSRVRPNQAALDLMNQHNVGSLVGRGDRLIIAEMAEISSQTGRPLTFITSDRKLVNSLCRMAGVCVRQGSSAMNEFAGTGFDVAFPGGGRVRVVPIASN